MRKKKGFTFMELVIVIAIFGVLVAVITPAWAHYLQRAKIKSQTQKAKTIFNAAQTVLVDLEFSERKYRALLGSSQDSTVKNYIYTPISGDEWYFYWNGSAGFQCNAKGQAIDFSSEGDKKKETMSTWNERFAKSINKIVDSDLIYKIKVKDYKVVAVASANNIHDRYLGGHPTSILNLKSVGVDTNSGSSDVEHTNARDIDLDWFDLNVASNPSQVNAS